MSRIPATSYVPFDAELRAHLDPDESMLWSSQPPTGLLLRKSDALLIPFSLLRGGFAIFWEFSVIAQGAPWFFLLFGATFVLFGLYIMVVRFFVDAWERMRMLYGVTDQRVMILSGLYRRTLHSLDLGGLTDIDIDVWRDGRGKLVFDVDSAGAPISSAAVGPAHTPRPSSSASRIRPGCCV